jgi:hypothetical protein
MVQGKKISSIGVGAEKQRHGFLLHVAVNLFYGLYHNFSINKNRVFLRVYAVFSSKGQGAFFAFPV